MRLRSLLLCGLLLPCVQACAIHPLQQDVTHLKTVQLVDRIKCEAQAALEDKIITLLQEERKTDSDDLIASLIADRKVFRNFKRSWLHPGTEQQFYDQYIKMAIAFNFTFNITEKNSASAQFDILKPFSGGTFSLGLNETGDLTRNDLRNFLVSAEFGDLLNQQIEHCDNAVFTPDYAYPISGAIGLKELIDTFVDLNRREGLHTIEKQNVFADTLQFTTAVMSSAGPKSTFVLAGRSLQLLDAGVTGTVSRTDVHTVIVGLSTPQLPPTARPAARTAAVGTPRLAGSSASTPLLAPSPTASRRLDVSPAQNAAVQATFDQRVNTFLDRFGDITVRP